MELYLLTVALTLLSAMAVGWSIGANDAANSVGTAVGSKVISLRTGIILIVVFGFLGAYFEGGNVVKTIGKGIVPINELSPNKGAAVALMATFASCA